MSLPISHYTKGDSSVYGKKLVYVIGHPLDIQKYIPFLKERIFALKNCVISHLDLKKRDMVYEDVSKDSEFFLNNVNSIILIVSKQFLQNDDLFCNREISYLIRRGIPFLPLFFEPNLEDAFNKKYHSLHGILPYSKDQTSIPFEQKLATFLRNTMGDQANDDIANVFKKHLFISYRKKDRLYANDIIRHIHADKQLYDIAVWYDEFLNPSENFNENIKEQISNADLVIFLVTKHLLEEGNYIELVEYKEAVNANKPFLAVECESVDRVLLEKRFPGITDKLISRGELLPFLKFRLKIRHKPRRNAQELYQLSLAYNYGCCVELDRKKAHDLMLTAAKKNDITAAGKLASQYATGFYGKVSLHDALYFYKKALVLSKKQCVLRKDTETFKSVCIYWEKVALLYVHLGETQKYYLEINKQTAYFEEYVRKHPSLEMTGLLIGHYNRIGDAFLNANCPDGAAAYYQKAEDAARLLEGQLKSENNHQVQEYSCEWMYYQGLRIICVYNRALVTENQDPDKALTIFEETEEMIQTLGEFCKSAEARSLLSSVYMHKGDIYYKKKDFRLAVDCLGKAHAFVMKSLEEDADDESLKELFFQVCVKEGMAFLELGVLKQAKKIAQRGYEYSMNEEMKNDTRVEYNRYTTKFLVLLALVYAEEKKTNKAREYFLKAKKHILNRHQQVFESLDTEVLGFIQHNLVEFALKQLEKNVVKNRMNEKVLDDSIGVFSEIHTLINEIYHLGFYPNAEQTMRYCKLYYEACDWWFKHEKPELAKHGLVTVMNVLERNLEKEWEESLATFWIDVFLQYREVFIRYKQEFESLWFYSYRMIFTVSKYPQMLQYATVVRYLIVSYVMSAKMENWDPYTLNQQTAGYVAKAYLCAALLLSKKYEHYFTEEALLSIEFKVYMDMLELLIPFKVAPFIKKGCACLRRLNEIAEEDDYFQTITDFKRLFSRGIPLPLWAFKSSALKGVLGLHCVGFTRMEFVKFIVRM